MKKPLVILDTSVLVVACISKRENYSSDLLNLAKNGKIKLVTTVEILDEVKNVFIKTKFKKLLNNSKSREILEGYFRLTEIIKIEKSFLEENINTCEDPNDIIFLALSKQVKADFLATLDSKHLLTIKKIGTTEILRPIDICQKIKS